MSSKEATQALEDILDNTLLASSFVKNITYETFLTDKRTVYAVIRALEIISEATRRLPEEIYSRYPHIPWVGIKGAGNIYRHDYEDVLESKVWATVINALPPLERVMREELGKLYKEMGLSIEEISKL
ncbi:MAG: DUF86 domain-containing protein [Alphaproteobacteria bacterium]|nr:DUF86 domain-containing protein [Alphaproteobacteria bacterium]